MIGWLPELGFLPAAFVIGAVGWCWWLFTRIPLDDEFDSIDEWDDVCRALSGADSDE